jgi:hypothetical protein
MDGATRAILPPVTATSITRSIEFAGSIDVAALDEQIVLLRRSDSRPLREE